MRTNVLGVFPGSGGGRTSGGAGSRPSKARAAGRRIVRTVGACRTGRDNPDENLFLFMEQIV
ncbi:hypothetical protein GD416_22110 [Burkholderia sp. BE24]|nr:hypothetical protein [Burkholderia sp. BE24]